MKIITEQPSSLNPRDNDNFNLREAIQKYLRYWPLFGVSIFASLLIAFLVNKYTPPVYRIQSKFLIKEQGNAMNLFDFEAIGAGNILPKGQKLANETIILKSRSLARTALDQLDFDVEYFEEGFFINKELYNKAPILVTVDWQHPQLVNGTFRIKWEDGRTFQLEFPEKQYSLLTPGSEEFIQTEKPVTMSGLPFGEWVELPYAKFKVYLNDSTTMGSSVVKFRDAESLLNQYTGESLQIYPSDKISSILVFSLETHQPQKGRDYLNKLMRVCLDNELEEKNAIARNTVKFIDSQLSGISDSLNYTENKLEKFRSRNRTYNITSEGSSIFEKLSELEKSLAEENFKKEYYQNLQTYLVRENYQDIVVPSGLGMEDPVLNKLVEELIMLQSDKSRLLATQTENSPTVMEVNRKIAALNNSIKEVLTNVIQNTSFVIADLEKRIKKIENQFGRLPQTEQDLLNIKRKYSLNENIYTYLLQRRAEGAISLASNTASNKIIEHAVLNLMPLKLKPLLNYFIAGILGLLLPVTVIFLIEVFSVRIKDLKEMEQRLQVPVLGYIGENKQDTPLVVLHEPKAAITEAFRALRTNINFTFPKDKQVTIMITSTIAGEGKTFCAMNLASVYSISRRRTVLMGCDMHKRVMFHDFNISNTTGLSNYLSGDVGEVSGIIQRTGYDNLHIIAPGPVPPNPAELLISNRFEQLIDELKKRYEVIILDSSPLGLTNETLYLTRMADVSIFVLRQNFSEKSFIDDINSIREKKGLKNTYVVINDVEDKYLKHHGYGYGYYAEDGRKQKRKSSRHLTDRAAL